MDYDETSEKQQLRSWGNILNDFVNDSHQAEQIDPKQAGIIEIKGPAIMKNSVCEADDQAEDRGRIRSRREPVFIQLPIACLGETMEKILVLI
jgi:hypothetical protein